MNNYPSEKNYFRIFTALFIVATIILSSLSLGISHFEHMRILEEDNKIKADQELKKRAAEYKSRYDLYKDILYALNRNDIFKEYLNTRSGISKKNLNNLFYAMAKQDRNIMELCFLDKEGNKKTGLKREQAGFAPFIIPQNKLQNSREKHYFKNSINLPKNELYISKLDLNKYEPLLHLAAPVFKGDKKEGVIVIKVFMKEFLKKIVSSGFLNIYIFDQEGFILFSNDKSTKNLDKKTHLKTPLTKELFIGAKSKFELSILDHWTDALTILLLIILPLSILFEYIISRVPKALFKNLEKQQKTLLKQSRLSAMGEMVESLAHQWRQPLNVVSVLTQEIKLNHRMDTLDKEKMNQLGGEIQTYLDNMSRVIDDFRTFFKPKRSKDRVDVKKCMDNTIRLIQPKLDDNLIELNFEVDEKEQKVYPFILFAWEIEVKQLFLNILNNSVDAIINSQDKVKKIEVKMKKIDENLYIAVSDTGGGIKEEIKEKIFEPYFSTKSNELQGTGLGLYIVKTIVENSMNGEIKVSNTQEGARFEIILPIS